MLSASEVVNLMRKRNFEVLSEKHKGDLHVSTTFIKVLDDYDKRARMPVPAYTCEVLKDNYYKLSYIINGSLNSLVSPILGDFENDEKFNKQCELFSVQAAVLNNYFKET